MTDQKTNLDCTRYFGALDMLSIPPATTTSLTPDVMLSAAIIIAEINESMLEYYN